MDAEVAADGSRLLLPELIDRFASYMSLNHVACNLRLVSKAAAAVFRGRKQYTTVRLSQPVPPHAFAWRWAAPGATRSLTLKQRQQLLRLTAASGSIPNMEALAAAVGISPARYADLGVLRAAATAGRVDMCRYFLSCYQAEERNLFYATLAAAMAGQQAVCEYFLTSHVPWDATIATAAALGGHHELMDWLLLQRPEGPIGPADSLQRLKLVDRILLLARVAEGCSLAALQSVYTRCGFGQPLDNPELLEDDVARLIDVAAGSPTADWQAKVEWLELLAPPGHRGDSNACTEAARCPDGVDRLVWLRQRGYPLNAYNVALKAAKNECLAVLEYSLPAPQQGTAKERQRYSPIALAAAGAGRLDMLQLLHARMGRVRPLAVAREAARGGHSAVVVWAVEQFGAAVLEAPELLAAAAGSGSVELMAWLRGRGCAWGEEVFLKAAESGCEEAVEWAAAQGCPMPHNGLPYALAAQNGDIAMERCLRRLGCPAAP